MNLNKKKKYCFFRRRDWGLPFLGLCVIQATGGWELNKKKKGEGESANASPVHRWGRRH